MLRCLNVKCCAGCGVLRKLLTALPVANLQLHNYIRSLYNHFTVIQVYPMYP